MPWYKFTSNHGPGHQGHSEVFQFFDHKLNEEELREEWEYAFRKYGDNVGDAVIVRRLPVAVANEKKLYLVWTVEGAVETLGSRFGIKVKVEFPKGVVKALKEERKRRNERENARHRRKMERLATAARDEIKQKGCHEKRP